MKTSEGSLQSTRAQPGYAPGRLFMQPTLARYFFCANSVGPLLFIWAVMSLLLLRGLGDASLGYPDADRLLMDGVFVLDFLRAMPLDRVIDFTKEYYAQYPALSIGYRPPFFPFVEAVFNGIFGVNTWSSRLAIVAFAIGGIGAWYALVKRVYDCKTAFWSALLLATTPYMVQWGWYTMGEIPLLAMAMITAYFFYRYSESQAAKYLYLTTVFFCLTAWTKQTSIFLGLWFVAYLAYRGQLLEFFKRRESWIAIGIAALLLTPLAIITLWLGDLNIQQSVGSTASSGTPSRLSVDNLLVLWNTLAVYHLAVPVLILSVAGIAASGIKRDRRAIFFGLLILVTYLFFSFIAGKNPRYPIFWIPAFTLFAALLAFYPSGKAVRMLATAALASAVLLNVIHTYRLQPQYATGYDQAAAFVLQNSKSPTVFFDGYNNGYFTYFMRASDGERSMHVLRADKLLSSSAINPNIWLEVHAHSDADIQRMLDEYGIDLIVVEDRDVSGIEIHQRFRQFLQTSRFQRLASIPVHSNRNNLRDQRLSVYRYLEAKPLTAEYLTLKLPVVGQEIKIPLRKFSGPRPIPMPN